MSSSSAPHVEGVIIISYDEELPPEHFIRKILDVDTLPTASLFNNNIKGYLWQFETKYYSAEVMLYAVEEKMTFDHDFLDSIKATVFCFDSNKLSSFEEILCWMPLLEKMQPEIQLLVCNNFCSGHGITVPAERNVLNWCIQNHFELIELYPGEESDDKEDILPDVKGYDRIVQALQAHVWSSSFINDPPLHKADIQKDCLSGMLFHTLEDKSPGQCMEEVKNDCQLEKSEKTDESLSPCKEVVQKDDQAEVLFHPLTDKSPALCKEELNKDCQSEMTKEPDTVEDNSNIESKSKNKEASGIAAASQNFKQDSKKMQVDNEELLLEQKWIEHVLGHNDPGGESFEALFSKFATLKEKASGLTGDERKKYAEQVTIAFWRAMGFEEDEIAGLDDE